MPKYEGNFARLYDFLVYEREEAEANEKELNFLEWAFREVCPINVKEILDIGCGNGRFLIPLTRREYRVTGLDNSEEMLEECSRRLKKYELTAPLILQDLKTLEFEEAFDAVLDNLDVDSVTMRQIQDARDQITRLSRQGLPDEVEVFRAGPLTDEFVNVSKVPRQTFGPQQRFTIPRDDVMVDTNRLMGANATHPLEEELLVRALGLRPLTK